jgi:hypothetical protein
MSLHTMAAHQAQACMFLLRIGDLRCVVRPEIWFRVTSGVLIPASIGSISNLDPRLAVTPWVEILSPPL